MRMRGRIVRQMVRWEGEGGHGVGDRGHGDEFGEEWPCAGGRRTLVHVITPTHASEAVAVKRPTD